MIDPSVAWPETEGCAEVIGDWPGEVRVVRPALDPGTWPPPGGYGADGVVLMGSRASVHDDLAWLHRLGDWLDPLLDGARPIPLLGICFGHQLIAHRAGGRIGWLRPDHRGDLGVRETDLEGSRLFPDGRKMRVVASHAEIVEAAPPSFRVVASRDGVPVDAVEHERLPVFAVQFHPEARGSFLARRGADPSQLDADAAEANARLLASFRDLVLGRLTGAR